MTSDIKPDANGWYPIETAPPPHATPVLLYCPYSNVTSHERMEAKCYSTGRRGKTYSTMSYHPWATHWQPLPKPPVIDEEKR